MIVTSKVLPKIRAVGLSISKCIAAIAEGKIPIDAVKKVVGGTMFANPEELLAEYSQKYWKHCNLNARKVFCRLMEFDQIEQPRLFGNPGPDASKGIWQIGSFALQTEQFRELLDISEFFLTMTANRRDTFFDNLPMDAVQLLIKELLNDTLNPLFPEMEKISGQVPPAVLIRMLKDRLKQFFQTASEKAKDDVHLALIQILGPFLKENMKIPEPEPSATPQEAAPFKHSTYWNPGYKSKKKSEPKTSSPAEPEDKEKK